MVGWILYSFICLYSTYLIDQDPFPAFNLESVITSILFADSCCLNLTYFHCAYNVVFRNSVFLILFESWMRFAGEPDFIMVIMIARILSDTPRLRVALSLSLCDIPRFYLGVPSYLWPCASWVGVTA